MTMAAEPFEHAIAVVVTRVGELLRAPVSAVNGHGAVIAASRPVGDCHLGEPTCGGERDDLRFPIQFDGHTAVIVIEASACEGTLTPHLAHAIIELTISQVTVVERLPDLYELKNRLIHDLLRGDVGDHTNVLREAQILGMDLSRPRAVILIDASEYILAASGAAMLPDHRDWVRQRRARARVVISSVVRYFTLPNEMICAYIGDGEVAVLKASGSSDLVAWVGEEQRGEDDHPTWANLAALKRATTGLLAQLHREAAPSISIGIGRFHQGLSGLSRSYTDARTALSLGRRLGGCSGVRSLDDLGLAALVTITDEPTKRELALRLLGPLDHQPELVQTLDAFFAEDCSPLNTANRLSIHRNTLGYRLEKITHLTGLDPRRFNDAIQLRLARLICTPDSAPDVVRTPKPSDFPIDNVGQPSDARSHLAPVA